MRAYSLQRALEFIEPWLATNIQASTVPGCTVAICHKNQIVFSKAFGFTDYTQHEPLTTDHIFCVASQSKMFTATAIMQLIERQQLSLNDFVVQYLPWLDKHSDKRIRQVTIEQLLWHGAGLIRDGLDAGFWHLERPFPDTVALQDMVLTTPLVFNASSKLKYSNVGYALLGKVIEVVSGVSYQSFVQKQIMAPLHLRRTYVNRNPALEVHLVPGYSQPLRSKRIKLQQAQSTNTFTPATGWCMSIMDMCKFAIAQYMESPLLQADNRHLLHNGRRGHWTAHKGTDYRLGFMQYLFGGRRVVGHSGSFLGHRSCTFFDQDDQLAVVIMGNTKDMPIMTMAKGIFSILDYFRAYATAPVSLDLARFNQRLFNVWGLKEIVATNKRIVTVYTDEWLPFLHVDELTYIDPATLCIKQSSDLASQGERVVYNFNKGILKDVKYAGITMYPDNIASAVLHEVDDLAGYLQVIKKL